MTNEELEKLINEQAEIAFSNSLFVEASLRTLQSVLQAVAANNGLSEIKGVSS